MRVTDIEQVSEGSFVRLSAIYHWEDSDRPAQEIVLRYEAPEDDFDPALTANAFLTAAVVPALRRGERRISVEGAVVCPWLVDNLRTFMDYLLYWHWYTYDRDPANLWQPSLDVQTAVLPVRTERRTGFFYSGGVDSLYCLRRNRTLLGKNHPGSIRDAIFVHGFDMGTRPALGSEEAFFRSVIDQMRPVLESEQVQIIPVFANLRSLDKGTDCWLDEYMAAAMATVAHALAGRLTDVLVASSYDIATLHPFACHPLTDPRLSSFGLRVNHDGERLSRVDRVRLIADWPEAMQTLRICFFGNENSLNCGRCPKCIRTKLELIAVDRLGAAATMPGGAPTPDEVRDGLRVQDDTVMFMNTLTHALQQVGRGDLAAAVRHCTKRYRRQRMMDGKHLLRQLDRGLLHGRLKRALVARRDAPET